MVRDFYPLPQAAEMIGCTIDDLIHYAASGHIQIIILTSGQRAMLSDKHYQSFTKTFEVISARYCSVNKDDVRRYEAARGRAGTDVYLKRLMTLDDSGNFWVLNTRIDIKKIRLYILTSDINSLRKTASSQQAPLSKQLSEVIESAHEMQAGTIPAALVIPSPVDDGKLAALFDPVTIEALSKMFPTEKWSSWALHPKQNGLIVARQGRGTYNPYKAGLWFLTKKVKGWDSAAINRVLAKNLPTRSRHDDGKYLLTGDQD